MRTLLVMTTGQTDVQLAIDGVRRELLKDRCAALHDDLERRASECRIVDAPIPKEKPPVEALPEGELLLCTPKLDAVLRKVQPTSALLLETRRDASSTPSDPRYAGAVLEARLKEKGVATVYRRAYLEGTERLEDRNEPRDAVIRRDVVHRLEDAVREAIETVNPSRIVAAATGGFPVVSNLVEEIVRLHASVPSVQVEALEVADGAQANPPIADRAVARTSVPEPIVSFQARRRVLELLDKGNLLGAWAIAEPLHGDEAENKWTKVIEWLARFASSLPIPKGCDIRVLEHERMAVRGALRVELALRAGDIPRAVHGTVAFFESALWDHLNERFERSPDPKKRRYYKLKKCDAPSEDKLLRKGDGSDEDRKRPFELKETVDGVDWYWISDDDAPAGRIAKYYLKLEGLQKLSNELSGDIRELRNDVAHKEPTPALMDHARRKMEAKSLWSKKQTFLSQKLVQDVLKELGVAQPDRLLDTLSEDVRKRLREPKR